MTNIIAHKKQLSKLQWVRGPITPVMVTGCPSAFIPCQLQWVRGPITPVMARGRKRLYLQGLRVFPRAGTNSCRFAGSDELGTLPFSMIDKEFRVARAKIAPE